MRQNNQSNDNLLGMIAEKIIGFYEKLPKSSNVIPATSSSSSPRVPTKEEKAMLDYAASRISAFYNRRQEANNQDYR